MVEWTLPADATAAREARRQVAGALGHRQVGQRVVDDVVLMASELAANAVRHGRPPALLRLEHSGGRIRLTVSNHGNAADPRIVAAAPDADHGRGLAIVEQLADDLGWRRDGDRLEVWAEVRVSSPD